MRLLALLRDWWNFSVPAEVSRDMPRTIDEFRAQRGQTYPQENVELARRRVAEIHSRNVTASPIHRKAS